MKKAKVLIQLHIYNASVIFLVLVSAALILNSIEKRKVFEQLESDFISIKNSVEEVFNENQQQVDVFVDNKIELYSRVDSAVYFDLIKTQEPFINQHISYKRSYIASSQSLSAVYFHFYSDTLYSNEQFFSVVQLGVDPGLIQKPFLSYRGMALIADKPVVFSFVSGNRVQKFLFTYNTSDFLSKLKGNFYDKGYRVALFSYEDQIALADSCCSLSSNDMFRIKELNDSLNIPEQKNKKSWNYFKGENSNVYFSSYSIEQSNTQFIVYKNVDDVVRLYRLKIVRSLLYVLIVILFIIIFSYLANWHVINPFDFFINNFNIPGKYNATTSNSVAFIRKDIDRLQNQLKQYQYNITKSIKDQERITRDLDMAKKLQRNILPGNDKTYQENEFQLYAFSEFAYDIGGDLYDYFLIDEDHLLIVVGDVSGKGIPASLYMVFTLTILRSLSAPDKKVEEIADKLNERLFDESESDLFVTMFIGILNFKTGELNYTNAAHCFPMLIRKEGTVEQLTDTHGIPMGVYLKRTYSSSSIKLNEGDTLFVYTDGVIDIKDENDMNYSEEVLRFNLMGTWFYSPESIVSKIYDSLTTFRGNMDPVDDITMVAFKYKPAEDENVDAEQEEQKVNS